jgi:polyhydroxyalkanoate synthase
MGGRRTGSRLMPRLDLPGPMLRRGPRPLMMHLLPAPPPPTPPLPTQAPPTPAAAWPGWADPALIHGIAAYRRHPWRRSLPDPAVLWQEADTRLLDYGAGDPRARPVLFVPSLVNRAYVLDLLPDRSLLRWLAAHGLRPLLLDWGWPGVEDRNLTLAGLVTGRLERALAAAGRPVVLAGYCMGGLLALAAALRRPDLVEALALLATPWDFHAAHAEEARRLGAMLPLFEPMLAATGSLPVDALQALFATPDPGAIAAKFRAFGRMDQASPAARDFVALEDWLNDGVPLAAPVARETLGEWYGLNTPGRGVWQVDGSTVEPGRLAMPAFIAAPARDRIVPPDSALPLARLIPGAVLHQPRAGHIGMVAGPRAEAELWRPLLGWLQGLRPIM